MIYRSLNTIITATLLIAWAMRAGAQARIGTAATHPSAILDIQSNSRGLLIPRMTQAFRNAFITNPPNGLLVFQTDQIPGFYLYNGGAWQSLTNADTVPAAAWPLYGIGEPVTNLRIGTTNNRDLPLYTNNNERMRLMADRRIGINTSAPIMGLDVADGDFLCTQSGTPQANPTALPVLGNVNNMLFFNSRRAALFVGVIIEPDFIHSNFGIGSLTHNIMSGRFARGRGSVALGGGATDAAAAQSFAAHGGMAQANWSVALRNQVATSAGSMAFTSRADGQYSAALGSQYRTYSYGECTAGYYGIERPSGSASTFVSTDALFAIGGGVNTPNGLIRHNLLAVYKNGFTRFYHAIPSGLANPITDLPEYRLDLGFANENKAVAYGYATYSDERLKTSIQPLTVGIETLMQLQPAMFRWIDEPDTGDVPPLPQLGFLAQQVEQVLPSVVFAPKSQKDAYAMDYSKLIPVITKAMQQQQELIEKIQERLKVLENKLK